MKARRGSRAEPRTRLARLVGAALLAAALSDADPGAAQQPMAAPGGAVEAMVLSPEPGDRVLQDGVLVAVSFIDRDARLDPVTIRVEVDGRDVTAEAVVTAEVVSWSPREPIEAGPHRAVVSARARDGAAIGPVSWAFTVAPGYEASPSAAFAPTSTSFARFQGSVTFEGNSRRVSGPGAPLLADKENVPQLWVNVGGLLGGSWRYSGRVFVSAYENDLRQPVDRFRFDLRSNHLSLGLGDVNPALHDLILAGERVRGVQADMKAGPLRLGLVKGTTRRAVPGAIDPSNPATVLRAGTYGQNLIGIRPAFGGDHLLVGITAVRVTDDTASIADLRVANGVGGATRRVNPTPKDNLVVGTDATARLFGSRLLLQYQGAASLLANDITGGPMSKPQLDSIMEAAGADPIDLTPADYADYFIINQSMIPLDPRGLTNLAHLASASLRTGTNIASFEWRSIGGSYYSLAHPALLRDRRGIRIRDSFSALRGALAVTGGFETDEDNLDDVKPATTTNTGVFVSSSWQASPASVSLVGSVRAGSRSNDLPKGQTGALDESSNAVSVGAGIPIGALRGFRNRLNLNVTSIRRKDPQNPIVDSEDRYFLFGVQGETDSRARRFNLMYGINTTELTSVADSKTDYGRLVGNVRWLLAPRWTATLDGTYSTASTDDRTALVGLDYARRELLAGAQYDWTETSFVTLTAGVVKYADALLPTRNTTELLTRLTVHRAF